MADKMILEKEQAPGKTVRGFRGSAEVENLYRFVNEFRLRRETKMTLEAIRSRLGLTAIKTKKKRGRKKKTVQ